MEELKELDKKFISYLDEKMKSTMEDEQRLILEERKDEANLCRVKNNIYGIYKTLYASAKKQANGNEVITCFLKKAEMVPKNWSISYEKAKEHQDVSKILIEETKLLVVEEIKQAFYQFKKEA